MLLVVIEHIQPVQYMASNEHQESRFRNSRMEFDLVYFWTDTIKDWKHLLKQDKYT